jgi:hypothetical protein
MADLTSALLAVELVLLVATLALLIQARRESSGREKLLEQMAHTARIVSRQEYFNAVHFVMQSARKSIEGSVTGSLPSTPEQTDQVQAIIDRISLAKSRGVKIRYILPKSPDRLVVANRYREAGAEVGFHPGIIVSDLRYTVIDGAYTVLGLPSSAGENQPTREGYVIPSEALAEIFLRQFQSRWDEATPYDDYLRTTVSDVRTHNPKVSIQLLASQLQVPESEIRRTDQQLANSSTTHSA